VNVKFFAEYNHPAKIVKQWIIFFIIFCNLTFNDRLVGNNISNILISLCFLNLEGGDLSG
jgi:hypothetical protein